VYCVAPRGVFERAFTKTSGTCGDLPTDQVVIAPGEKITLEACTQGQVSSSPDGCSVTSEFLCPGEKDVLSLNETSDAANLTGAFNLTLDGNCQGTYSVAAHKLHD
jgi:hypothetical protein